VHISKENAYDDNNNVIRFVYHASVSTTQGLEWTFNTDKFNIIRENLPKNSQNMVLMLGIVPFFVNVIANDFQVTNELFNLVLNHKIAFMNVVLWFGATLIN